MNLCFNLFPLLISILHGVSSGEKNLKLFTCFKIWSIYNFKNGLKDIDGALHHRDDGAVWIEQAGRAVAGWDAKCPTSFSEWASVGCLPVDWFDARGTEWSST